MDQGELETDARPGSSESQKKPTATGSDQPRVIEHVHRSGGKTTIHIGPGPASELPNIQVGDQNYMVIGGSTRGSKRSNKVNKKPKQKIEAPDRPITDEECDKISENLGRDYKKFCRKLGFKEVQIEQVEMDFRDEGHYEVAYQLLRKLRQLGKDKLPKVVDALQSIDRDDILEELKIT